MRTQRYLSFTLFFVALGISQADPMPNLVVNGGFETGDFTGWTVSGDTSPCLFVGALGDTGVGGVCDPATNFGPESGNFAAYLGNDTWDAYLTQDIVTNTPNGTYTISFWLASQTNTPPTDFSVYWGGTKLLGLTDLPAMGWTQYVLSGLTAKGPTTTLQFAFRDDATYLGLDNVSVVDPVVPEPNTLVILGLGLAMLVAVRYRRKRSLPNQA